MSSYGFNQLSDIRVGVVGYGGAFNMGRSHLEGAQQAGMTPAAVVDINEERLTVAAAEFPGIETYTSLDNMLEQSDVNLVTIITPHDTHAPLALKALAAGRHVVCEKPLAITIEACNQMIETAKRNGVVLSTYHNRHWDGCILEALEQVKEKKAIGEVYRIEAHMGYYRQPRDWWRARRSISGGILYDWGVHLLEYALQIIDADMVEVSGYAKTGYWAEKLDWEEELNEDEAFAVVRFQNGVWLTLNMTNLDHNPKPGALEIAGTEGTYVMEVTGAYKIIQRDGPRQIITSGTSRPGEQYRYYQNVANHLVTGEDLIITAEWARRPIQILDYAVRSAKQGTALKVRYP